MAELVERDRVDVRISEAVPVFRWIEPDLAGKGIGDRVVLSAAVRTTEAHLNVRGGAVAARERDSRIVAPAPESELDVRSGHGAAQLSHRVRNVVDREGEASLRSPGQ